VSDRKEALEQRLQEFVLELLAAIVLMAILMIVTDPATREDC
jgi:glycerol uptake facilitator-like aquaporin